MNKQVEAFISIQLEGKEVIQLTNQVLDLMSGSVDLVGCGGMVGGTERDFDIVADTQEELDDFLELLVVRGYNFKNQ
tara:strand:+ start:331 stop:561 length:231 start_codon:yes stop_codon:yes gene_type:complete